MRVVMVAGYVFFCNVVTFISRMNHKKAFTACLRNDFSDQVTYVIVIEYVVLLPNSGSNSMLASLKRTICILVKSRLKN